MVPDGNERLIGKQSLVMEAIGFSISGHNDLFAKAMFVQMPEVSQECLHCNRNPVNLAMVCF